MRSFVEQTTMDPVPAHLLRWLRTIDRGQGLDAVYRSESRAVLDVLSTRSRVESAIASNEIEGVQAPRARAEAVLSGDSVARDRSEQELVGYNAALDEVYANPHVPVTVPRLLSWHRELFRHAGPDVAGRLKRHDNIVLDRAGEARRTRFRPVSAADTPFHLEELVHRYSELDPDAVHPVIAIAAFVLDLLVIHPFEDGNGRTARIATNALLLGRDYDVCRYISIERLVERRRSRYYDSLEQSTTGWHTSTHSLWPWAQFLAELLADAYVELEERAGSQGAASAKGLVTRWLRGDAPRVFSFSEACSRLAGVPRGTVRSVLNEARAAGALRLEGAGRGTRWVLVDRDAIPPETL